MQSPKCTRMWGNEGRPGRPRMCVVSHRRPRATAESRRPRRVRWFASNRRPAMHGSLEMLDLAALLCSRVCHDLTSPAGAEIDLGHAETVARGLLEDDKTRIAWNLPRTLSPKNRVKLLLNLLILAGQTIPRGGILTVDEIGDGEIQGLRVTAAGLNARIPQAIPGLVSGEAGSAAIDAHAIQPFYTGLLARSCGLSVALVPDGDRIVITAGWSRRPFRGAGGHGT